MSVLTEGNLQFDFPSTWEVTKYDDWTHYRNQFQSCCNGNKAVDFLALQGAGAMRTLWLIEVKDYRLVQRTKTSNIWDEVAEKVRDTLAGIVVAAVSENHDNQEFARRSVQITKLRVILHLEQPLRPSRIRPRAFNPADIEQKLKQIVKPIDAHPKVTEIATASALPWAVSNL